MGLSKSCAELCDRPDDKVIISGFKGPRGAEGGSRTSLHLLSKSAQRINTEVFE